MMDAPARHPAHQAGEVGLERSPTGEWLGRHSRPSRIWVRVWIGRQLCEFIRQVEGCSLESTSKGHRSAAGSSLRADPQSHGRGSSFQALRQVFGGQVVTARAWFEHRSKVGYYPTTIRIGWALSKIVDLLKDGSHSEALTRSLLLLSALDQAAIDSGSWLLSAEVLLDTTSPPFSSFQKKPHVDSLDSPHTRLLEARWIELMVHRLRERDSYIEVRRKLGKPNGARLDADTGQAEDAAGIPSAKGPGRGRQRKAKCLRPEQLNAARHTHSSLSQSRCPAAADTDCQSLARPILVWPRPLRIFAPLVCRQLGRPHL